MHWRANNLRSLTVAARYRELRYSRRPGRAFGVADGLADGLCLSCNAASACASGMLSETCTVFRCRIHHQRLENRHRLGVLLPLHLAKVDQELQHAGHARCIRGGGCLRIGGNRDLRSELHAAAPLRDLLKNGQRNGRRAGGIG